MKKIRLILIFLLTFSASGQAQNSPLTVAVSRFDPPFVMQGAHNQLYGFDISMMKSICKIIERDCHYQIMNFDEILNAVATEKADLAIGAIGITSERAQIVNLSLPYLPSESRFLGPKELANKPFSLQLLKNKIIGITKGTVFKNEIKVMGIKNPTIVELQYDEKMIEALSRNRIDVALMDTPSALYWQNRTSGILKVLGDSMPYGYCLGIAVNPNDPRRY